MKITKSLFAKDSFEKSNELSLEGQRRLRTIEDLKLIRSKIIEGKMNKNLADFINKDGTLDLILQGLPTVATEGMDSLRDLQVAYLSSAIHQQEVALEGFFDSLIEWFKNWFENYWDQNRIKFNQCRKMKAMFGTNPGAFGSPDEFEKMQVTSFHGPEWSIMAGASKKLAAIVKTIPTSNLKDWVEKNRDGIASCLKEFGVSIENGTTLKVGNPVHTRSRNSCRGHRYMFNQIGSTLDLCIGLLGDERESRRLVDQVIGQMKKAPEEDRPYIQFIKSLVVQSKILAFNVVKSYYMIVHQAVATHASAANKQPTEQK